MTDHGHSSGHGAKPKAEGFDSEIDVRHIVEVAAWLAGTTIVAAIVGYFFYRGLAKGSEGTDPKPSPLAEASARREPPLPRLQITPEKDLQEFRRGEQERLTTWGWVDRASGVAHMPISEAIARLAPAEAAAAPAPAAAPEAPAEAPAAHETAAPAEH